MTKKPIYWLGTLNDYCQICHSPYNGTMIDGVTSRGWANMCVACHAVHGCGLGPGRGQKYTRERHPEAEAARNRNDPRSAPHTVWYWRKVEP